SRTRTCAIKLTRDPARPPFSNACSPRQSHERGGRLEGAKLASPRDGRRPTLSQDQCQVRSRRPRMTTPLLIGVSARIHHPHGLARDLGGVYTKTLHYLEQSVAHWVISANVLVFMIPAIESEGLIKRSDMRLYHYAEALDGLVLQGGADMAPESYGAKAERDEWAGDRVRDRYEIELF